MRIFSFVILVVLYSCKTVTSVKEKEIKVGISKDKLG